MHLIQTNAEEGYGKFIILGSLLFFTSPKYRPRPSYRNIELNVLSWQGINFWARLLGFKHRNTLIKHVLATEGGKCTFIIAKKGSGVPAYVAVGSMEDIKLMIGQRLEKISEDICDMTIPYEICVSALKKVWEYREK